MRRGRERDWIGWIGVFLAVVWMWWMKGDALINEWQLGRELGRGDMVHPASISWRLRGRAVVGPVALAQRSPFPSAHDGIR